MEQFRTALPEGELEPESSSKRSVEELLETVGGEDMPEPREDVQVSMRNLTTNSPPIIHSIYPITKEDLQILQEDLPVIVFAGDISPGIIRSSHHAMARDLANGHSRVDVSRQYGLSVQVIESLLQAPAFLELMEEYKGVEELAFDMETKMEALARDGLDEIRTRLELKPDKFSTTQLMELSGDMLDRTGYGKMTKQMQLNGGLSGPDLKRIKKAEPKLIGSKNTGDEIPSPADD